MKLWKLFPIGAAFLSAALSSAQMTTVNATVVDSDGVTWANGTVTAQFVPNSSQPSINIYRTASGNPLDPAIITQGPVALSGAGSFEFLCL